MRPSFRARELGGRSSGLRDRAARRDFSSAAKLPVRLVAPVVGLQEISSLVHLLAVELRLTGFVQNQVKSVVLLDLS